MTSPPPGLANTAGSLRQKMAAASSICQISPTRCQARTRLYRDGKLELEGFPVADIRDYLADGSVTIWLDLRGPDRDDLAVLSEEFGLHPLAVEAALRPSSQRPKLDRYRSHLLLTYPGFGEKAGFAASIVTIALTGLVLYLIFKRKDWL
jgi:magnesium transporter